MTTYFLIGLIYFLYLEIDHRIYMSIYKKPTFIYFIMGLFWPLGMTHHFLLWFLNSPFFIDQREKVLKRDKK